MNGRQSQRLRELRQAQVQSNARGTVWPSSSSPSACSKRAWACWWATRTLRAESWPCGAPRRARA
eukprot:4909219-Pyramimonas_sp.AAC.1